MCLCLCSCTMSKPTFSNHARAEKANRWLHFLSCIVLWSELVYALRKRTISWTEDAWTHGASVQLVMNNSRLNRTESWSEDAWMQQCQCATGYDLLSANQDWIINWRCLDEMDLPDELMLLMTSCDCRFFQISWNGLCESNVLRHSTDCECALKENENSWSRTCRKGHKGISPYKFTLLIQEVGGVESVWALPLALIIQDRSKQRKHSSPLSEEEESQFIQWSLRMKISCV